MKQLTDDQIDSTVASAIKDSAASTNELAPLPETAEPIWMPLVPALVMVTLSTVNALMG